MPDVPNGAADDVPRDGGSMPPSRVVSSAAFITPPLMLPASDGGLMTPVEVFFNGDQGMSVSFGSHTGAHVEISTTVKGLAALTLKLSLAHARALEAAAATVEVPLEDIPW